jgi:hypothetical protein
MWETLNSFVDLVLWRDGGQRQARRNAWQAMVADNLRARARADAADAFAALLDHRAPYPRGHGAGGEGRQQHG